MVKYLNIPEKAFVKQNELLTGSIGQDILNESCLVRSEIYIPDPLCDRRLSYLVQILLRLQQVCEAEKVSFLPL